MEQISGATDDARVLVALEGEQLVGFAFAEAPVRDPHGYARGLATGTGTVLREIRFHTGLG